MRLGTTKGGFRVCDEIFESQKFRQHVKKRFEGKRAC